MVYNWLNLQILVDNTFPDIDLSVSSLSNKMVGLNCNPPSVLADLNYLDALQLVSELTPCKHCGLGIWTFRAWRVWCYTPKFSILRCEYYFKFIYPSSGFLENFPDFAGIYSQFSRVSPILRKLLDFFSRALNILFKLLVF